ncbi:MAG: NAD-dependent epimerase/dehydratase family protein [Lawsonibacter sp.]|nr:NAD-dependent epimerase/dehydratase family protein [Lawsonibacter sp.]
MKFLVLGGAGVIGRQIVRQALNAGHEVTAFDKNSGFPPECAGAQLAVGDRYAADFAARFENQRFDAVIDMICGSVADAKATLNTFGKTAAQIIVTSSIASYNRPYRSYPLRESAERPACDPAFQYACDKAQMELYLKSKMGAQPAAITILRPSLTFGPGATNFGMLRQNRNVVRRIRQNRPVVMVGEGVIPWNITFSPDLGRAYLLACGNQNTYNDDFHVTANEVVMWEDLYRAVGRAVGHEPDMAYISSVTLRRVLGPLCGHLNFEKVYFSVCDNSKFRQAVPEFEPRVCFDKGIRQLVGWWETSGFAYDEEKDRQEDELCGAYDTFRRQLTTLGAKQK